MIMTQRKFPLNQQEINRHLNKEGDASIVFDVAVRTGYHPSGYSIWSEKIVKEDGKYFATWTSSSSCD